MTDAGNVAADRERDWRRAALTVVFLVLFGCGQTLFTAAAIMQLVWFLASGAPNPFLRRFGVSLGRWLNDTARYVFMDTDAKPFPWSAWPDAGA